MKYLNSYKVYEDMKKGGVNINLMQDLYDMCLDYFDRGWSLIVFIKGTAFVRSAAWRRCGESDERKERGIMSRFLYNHNNSININALKEDEWSSIEYYQIIITNEFSPKKDTTKEIVERLRGMYTNENINMIIK